MSAGKTMQARCTANREGKDVDKNRMDIRKRPEETRNKICGTRAITVRSTLLHKSD